VTPATGAHGGECVAHFAGQRGAHEAAVGHAGRVDARLIDAQRIAQMADECPHECEVVHFGARQVDEIPALRIAGALGRCKDKACFVRFTD
jgi:hypothetical protein